VVAMTAAMEAAVVLGGEVYTKEACGADHFPKEAWQREKSDTTCIEKTPGTTRT
tara:strand:+ start:155 stop:316 length:162 start_codon:yes stop_codon:yes gene_type:complete